jgi:hypothetical protein
VKNGRLMGVLMMTYVILIGYMVFEISGGQIFNVERLFQSMKNIYT